MHLKQVRFVIPVLLSVALEAGVSLAHNVASADARWPGVLDVIRRYPWPASGVLGVLLMVVLVVTGGNDETKGRADTAGQVKESSLTTVTTTAMAPVGRDLIQRIEIHNYPRAAPGERDKPTSEGPTTSAPTGPPTSGQSRLSRPAKILPYMAVGVILIATPALVLKSWSPHVPKAGDPFARTGHPPSQHSPTPAPSTPVDMPASATPTAHPVSEDAPIYQNKEVVIERNPIDVDTDQFLPSYYLGVRVSENHTGLNLDTVGYNQGMRLAIYSLQSPPGRKACIAQLDQVAGNKNGMYTRDAAVGQYVCLRTAEKNIAVIQFKKIEGGPFGPITADITLYRDLFALLDLRPDAAQNAASVYDGATSSVTLRSKAQVEALFDGWELTEPGVDQRGEAALGLPHLSCSATRHTHRPALICLHYSSSQPEMARLLSRDRISGTCLPPP